MTDSEKTKLLKEAEARNSEIEMRALYGEYIEESTLVMFKPETLIRRLTGKILLRFERKGLKLVKATTFQFNEDQVKEFYPHVADKPFFPGIVQKMCLGPVIVMVWRGHFAQKIVRNMIGATNPIEADAGTIRGDFGICLESEGNLIHSSDSEESYLRELDFFIRYANW